MERSQETPQSSQERQENQEERTWPEKIKDKFMPGVRITLLISLIFYIAMFVIGIWGVRKCPVEENIPFFLIVTGGIGLVSKTITILRKAASMDSSAQFVESSLYTMESVFLVFGSFWVFKEYKPSFDPSDNDFCNKTVYLFAFSYLACLYGIMFIVFVCFLCFLGCICFVKGTEQMHRDPESPTSPIRVSTSDNE